MILLRHAKRIAHDFGRGMDLPGLYSGRFLFCKQHDPEARQASAFRPGKDRAQRGLAPADLAQALDAPYLPDGAGNGSE